MTKKYKSGEIVQISGLYNQYDKNGNWVNEVTCVEGEPFPATRAEGGYFTLERKAKHEND